MPHVKSTVSSVTHDKWVLSDIKRRVEEAFALIDRLYQDMKATLDKADRKHVPDPGPPNPLSPPQSAPAPHAHLPPVEKPPLDHPGDKAVSEGMSKSLRRRCLHRTQRRKHLRMRAQAKVSPDPAPRPPKISLPSFTLCPTMLAILVPPSLY